MATPEDTNLKWYYFFHVLYSVIYGIVMINILIAIVSDSYGRIRDDEKAIDTLLKVRLLSEITAVKRGIDKLCMNRKGRASDQVQYDLYFISEKKEKEAHQEDMEILGDMQKKMTEMYERTKDVDT